MYKIALCGKANTGKNTTANIIIEELRKHNNCIYCKNIAFADPIKKIVRLMFPSIKRKFLFGPSKFRNEIIDGAYDDLGNKLTIRKALLDIGTKVGRSYKDTVWLDVFDHKFNEAVNNGYNVVIVPDLRFNNEYNHLKNKGFFIIKIIRNNDDIIQHISETEQDMIPLSKFDCVIDNNGSLYDLRNTIKNIIIPKIKLVQSIEK
jgi:DNA polymerase III delta prime subunit